MASNKTYPAPKLSILHFVLSSVEYIHSAGHLYHERLANICELERTDKRGDKRINFYLRSAYIHWYRNSIVCI